MGFFSRKSSSSNVSDNRSFVTYDNDTDIKQDIDNSVRTDTDISNEYDIDNSVRDDSDRSVRDDSISGSYNDYSTRSDVDSHDDNSVRDDSISGSHNDYSTAIDNDGDLSGNSGSISIHNEDITTDALDSFVSVTQEAFDLVRDTSAKQSQALQSGFNRSLDTLAENQAGITGLSKVLLPVAVIAGLALLRS